MSKEGEEVREMVKHINGEQFIRATSSIHAIH